MPQPYPARPRTRAYAQFSPKVSSVQLRRSKRIANQVRDRCSTIANRSPQPVILKRPSERSHRPRLRKAGLLENDVRAPCASGQPHQAEQLAEVPTSMLIKLRSGATSTTCGPLQSLEATPTNDQRVQALPPSTPTASPSTGVVFSSHITISQSRPRPKHGTVEAYEFSHESPRQQLLTETPRQQPSTSLGTTPRLVTSCPSSYMPLTITTNAMDISLEQKENNSQGNIFPAKCSQKDREKGLSSALSLSPIAPNVDPLTLSSDGRAEASAAISQMSDDVPADAPASIVDKSAPTLKPVSPRRMFTTLGCLEDSTSFLSDPLPDRPSRSVAHRLQTAFQQVWSSTCSLIKMLFVSAPDSPVARSVTSWSSHHP